MSKVDMPTGEDVQEQVTDNTQMWFGKHQGTKLKDLPGSYIYWLYDQEWVQGKYPGLYEWLIEAVESGEYQFEDNIIDWRDRE